MKLYPAKFSCNFDHTIYESDENYESVDGLMRGIFNVYFDRSGSPEWAIITIGESEISQLKDELKNGDYDEEEPNLLSAMKAIVAYADTHPAQDGMYCFITDDD